MIARVTLHANTNPQRIPNIFCMLLQIHNKIKNSPRHIPHPCALVLRAGAIYIPHCITCLCALACVLYIIYIHVYANKLHTTYSVSSPVGFALCSRSALCCDVFRGMLVRCLVGGWLLVGGGGGAMLFFPFDVIRNLLHPLDSPRRGDAAAYTKRHPRM